jgi:hypothetical protein
VERGWEDALLDAVAAEPAESAELNWGVSPSIMTARQETKTIREESMNSANFLPRSLCTRNEHCMGSDTGQ